MTASHIYSGAGAVGHSAAIVVAPRFDIPGRDDRTVVGNRVLL